MLNGTHMSGHALMAFDDLEVEALAVIANESAEQVESSARKTVEHAERCGRALLAAKEKVPHGQWLPWLAKNFDYNQQHASRYMTIASNYSRVSNLKEATSLRDALRMIAEDPETPKRERKPSVEVVEPIEAEDTIEVVATPVDEPRQTPAQANPRGDAAHRNPKPAESEFDLGSSLDDDRSAILDAAAEYIATKKLKHFVVMLRKVADDLEATIG
jgi:hypothetical protein